MGSVKMPSPFFWISTMALFTLSAAATVHQVGDSPGWTTLIPVDYAKWASSQKFHVGDTLRKYPLPPFFFPSPNFLFILLYPYQIWETTLQCLNTTARSTMHCKWLKNNTKLATHLLRWRRTAPAQIPSFWKDLEPSTSSVAFPGTVNWGRKWKSKLPQVHPLIYLLPPQAQAQAQAQWAAHLLLLPPQVLLLLCPTSSLC